MVAYPRKRKRKKGQRQQERQQRFSHSDTDVTIGECTSDFMKFLEEGLADGSIVAMGTFDDVPDFPGFD